MARERKYHIGDEVEITKPSDLIVGWNNKMESLIGRTGKVTKCDRYLDRFIYSIDTDGGMWVWEESYLLPVAPIEDVPDVAADITELYPWLTA